MNKHKKRVLVFGSNGFIGKSCVKELQSNCEVWQANRELEEFLDQINNVENFDGVIFAQGRNLEDSVENFDRSAFISLMEANVLFIIERINKLILLEKLKENSQIVIVSSIWSEQSRPNKLSYSITKSAINGLVRSLAIDLGHRNIFVNSVSPGAISSPMTESNLKANMQRRITGETPLKRLIAINEVTNIICKTVLGENRGITQAKTSRLMEGGA